MDKKYYFRTSIISIIILLITVAFFIYSLVVSVLTTCYIIATANESNDIGRNIFMAVLFTIFSIMGLIGIIHYFHGNIVLEENRIINYGDKRSGYDKIQYKSFAKYEKITNIEIKPLSMKSNGNRNVSLTRPIPYLCIYEGKRTHRFALHLMSTKTVKRLLCELILRCDKYGNKLDIDVDKLIRDFKKSRFAVFENDTESESA